MANNIFIRKTTIQTRFMTLHNKARSLFTIYNPHFQISRESQTKRLNFEPFGKTKRSKIDKRTVQKKHRKNIFLQCFFIALSFGYLTKNH